MNTIPKSRLAWVLLGASAICLAGLTLFSIYREEQSNTQRRTDLIEQQRLRLSEKLATYFTEIQLQLGKQLVSFHQEGLENKLVQWADATPLVHEARLHGPHQEIGPILSDGISKVINLESPDTPSILRAGYYQDNKEIALHEEGTIEPILFWSYRKDSSSPHWILGHRMAKNQPLSIAKLDTDALSSAFQSLLDQLAVPNLETTISSKPGKQSYELSSILPGHFLNLSLAPNPNRLRLNTLSYSIVILTLVIGVLSGILISRQVAGECREALRKTTFVSQISHEFKTPLTNISLYSDLLTNEKTPAEKRHKYLDTINRESHRLSEMVDNILTLNAIEAGKKKYRIQAFDLGDTIASIIADYQAILGASDIRLQWTQPNGVLRVKFDPAALRQILVNLLDNARKYAADGKTVRIGFVSTDPCQIFIEDEGPGIPPALHKKVFEAFYQKQSTLVDKSPGAGIGLGISRQMARDCQGDLSLDTTYTSGARFILELPLANTSPKS